MINEVYLIILIWLIAEIAGTIAGFWSSSIFLPLISTIVDFKSALLLVAIYHIFGNSTRLALFYKSINRKIVVLFWIPSVIATIIWASLTSFINSTHLKWVLWIILSVFAIYSLLSPRFSVRPSKKFWIIGWALSGLTAWLIGTGWVLRGAFMSLFNLPKEQYTATIALVALIVDFTRIPIYFSHWIDTKYLILLPVLFCTALLWSLIGKHILELLSTKTAKKVILIWVLLLSLHLAWQWIVFFL